MLIGLINAIPKRRKTHPASLIGSNYFLKLVALFMDCFPIFFITKGNSILLTELLCVKCEIIVLMTKRTLV